MIRCPARCSLARTSSSFGTGLQLATQVGERAATVFVGDEQSSDLLDGVVFVEVADGAG